MESNFLLIINSVEKYFTKHHTKFQSLIDALFQLIDFKYLPLQELCPKPTQWIVAVVNIYAYLNLTITPQTGNGLSFQMFCGEYGLRNAPDYSYAYRCVPQKCVPHLISNE